jgi:hypothetical protein
MERVRRKRQLPLGCTSAIEGGTVRASRSKTSKGLMLGGNVNDDGSCGNHQSHIGGRHVEGAGDHGGVAAPRSVTSMS